MRRTRSGAFRPYRMELLALYLTAAHGVYPRGGGALDNDDPVATWTDVRTGRSVSNATEAQQPLWKADSGLSTRPGLLFDGTDDILFTTTTPSVSDKGLIGVCGTIGTIGDYDDFAAASISTTSTDFIVWRPHYTSAAPNPSVFFDKAGLSSYDGCKGTSDTTSATSAKYLCDSNGAAWSLRWNEFAQVEAALGNGNTGLWLDEFTITHFDVAGIHYNNSIIQHLHITLCELVLLNEPNTQVQADLESYWKDEYGI